MPLSVTVSEDLDALFSWWLISRLADGRQSCDCSHSDLSSLVGTVPANPQCSNADWVPRNAASSRLSRLQSGG